jgi:hypothetical protein
MQKAVITDVQENIYKLHKLIYKHHGPEKLKYYKCYNKF